MHFAKNFMPEFSKFVNFCIRKRRPIVLHGKDMDKELAYAKPATEAKEKFKFQPIFCSSSNAILRSDEECCLDFSDDCFL
jgi:hypothetical protein